MTIDEINFKNFKIKKGAFAWVLIDANKNYVYKIFKSYNHSDLDGTGKEEVGKEETNDYRKKVFEGENNAYKAVQKSNKLKRVTPKYFGTIVFNKIFNGEDNVTNQYLRGCCIKLELIEGVDIKISNLLEEDKKEIEARCEISIKDLKDEFRKQGVCYLIDSSLFIIDTHIRIIDFSTLDPSNFAPTLDSI